MLHVDNYACNFDAMCIYIVNSLFLSVDHVEVGRPKGPVSKPALSAGKGAAGAASAGKDPITKLKEYCEKHKLSPVFEELKCGGQQFQFRVIVQGKAYIGSPQSNKKDARKSAAQKALNGLKL